MTPFLPSSPFQGKCVEVEPLDQRTHATTEETLDLHRTDMAAGFANILPDDMHAEVRFEGR